ncbi:MAG: hypothetical protein IJ093_03655 [Bacilli bacterium]|nr:hypothetical protein [Bacilli bacterium]
MKRTSYVDNQGNPIDYKFESKKHILRSFFVFGTIIPIILIGFIIYNVFQNNKCNKIYNNIKSAAYDYLTEEEKLPIIEGESEKISMSKLYSNDNLSSAQTGNIKCTGNIKVTKYKKTYIYTLELNNCNSCTTNIHYKGWSSESSYYPRNKSNIDVTPYYNYYERQLNTTEWTKYFTPEELSDKKSEYGIYLPLNINEMPQIPEEANIADVQTEEKNQYRYADKKWRWYDIVGDYSEFSSEQPDGYANKDTTTAQKTEWSSYSQNYPEEKSYREIITTTGYIYYYQENGKKIYANHKNYTASEDIDETKYNRKEGSGTKMYKYRDTKWRWYNGQQRRYSAFSQTKPASYNYRDDEAVITTGYTSWTDTSSLDDTNRDFRTEEIRVTKRYRYVYEILSDTVLDKPVNKERFIQTTGMTVPEFNNMENYKLEVSYKFKYQKR